MLGKGYLCAVVTQDAANWPTPAVMDTTGGSYKTEWIDGRAVSYHNHKEENPVAYGAKLSDAVKHGQAAPANHNTHGSRQGLSEQSQRNWQTFAHGTHNRGETPHRQVVKALVNGDKAKTQCLTVDQVFAEEIKGTNPKKELWRTPSVAEEKNQNTSTQIYLQNQVGATPKAWATPIMGDSHLASTPEVAQKRIEEGKVTLSRQNPGKLNPRWVETLMGLPVGWTMPSCKSPVTIELTSCASSATESSQQQPRELF